MSANEAELPAVLAGPLEVLSRELRLPPLKAVVDASAHRARLREHTLQVPVKYEVHWRRFRTLPLELIREAAYLAKQQQSLPVPDEADCRAFAEVFVRDHVLGDTEVERPY